MSIKSPLLYQVPMHEWERLESVKCVKVGRPGTWSHWLHNSQQKFVTLSGSFEIEINVADMIDDVIASAKHSKGGRATRMNGLIRCKIVNKKRVSERVVDLPIPEGTELVKSES